MLGPAPHVSPCAPGVADRIVTVPEIREDVRAVSLRTDLVRAEVAEPIAEPIVVRIDVRIGGATRNARRPRG